MAKLVPKKLTYEHLIEVVNYDPNTGVFRWRKRNGVAGTAKGGDGYIRIAIDKERHFAQRLAWFYVHKSWPSSILDHINGNKADNRIDNLRLADAMLNRANSKINANSRSGYRGVIWSERAKCWYVNITQHGKYIHLGCFKSLEAARAARAEHTKKLFGDFGRLS